MADVTIARPTSAGFEPGLMPGGRIKGPAAWRADDMARDPVWRYDLSAAEISELEGAMRASRDVPIIEISRSNFPLPRLGPKLLELRDRVMDGCGFVQMRGLPVRNYSKEEAARIFFGVGAVMGSLRSQNGEGHILGHVCDLAHDFHNDANLRGYRAGGPLKFHTDSVDIVALMCLKAARVGGESKLVAAATIHNEMLKLRPDLVPELYRPIHRDRRGEVPEGKDPWWIMPIFQWDGGNIFSHFSGMYIRSAERFDKVPRFTEAQLETIGLIEEIADDPANHVAVDFLEGDMQFVNNHTLLHGRADYQDWDDPAERRYLFRLWICPPNGKPLPPAYAERYGDIQIGDRGGIVCPGTEFKAPLDPI